MKRTGLGHNRGRSLAALLVWLCWLLQTEFPVVRYILARYCYSRGSHRGTPLSGTRWQEGRWCGGVDGPRISLPRTVPELLNFGSSWLAVRTPKCPSWVCAVVRRRFSSGCKSYLAIAPAGSNRSSHGGDEMAEAFGIACHELVSLDFRCGSTTDSEGCPQFRPLSGAKRKSISGD